MKLFACMCNQPQRLTAALEPVRSALLAQPPVSRWGLGYIQGGDVLLVRTPKSSTAPVDLASPLAEIRSDCAVAVAVRDSSTSNVPGGTDNTPPFRFRRWLFGMTPGAGGLEKVSARLLEHIPEYLRRNIRGRTPQELIFHVFLATLHDEGNIDDPNIATSVQRRALAATIRLVQGAIDKASREAEAPIDTQLALGNIAVTNGRSMMLAHLSEPLRVRRLTVPNDRGDVDPSFRGLLLLSGGDGETKDGFEDVPPRAAVLISRDLQLSFADLAP
jgi:predicted glutamine amidotransferase